MRKQTFSVDIWYFHNLCDVKSTYTLAPRGEISRFLGPPWPNELLHLHEVTCWESNNVGTCLYPELWSGWISIEFVPYRHWNGSIGISVSLPSNRHEDVTWALWRQLNVALWSESELELSAADDCFESLLSFALLFWNQILIWKYQLIDKHYYFVIKQVHY